MRASANDDRGAVLVFLAICMTALLALAGLALDGGRAYGERRQMQNAADAAAMAATRQLDLFITGQSNDARLIAGAAQDVAEANGATREAVSCEIVTFTRAPLGPCPSTATMSATMQASAAGVEVVTERTRETFFIRVVGADDFTARAQATAQVGRAGGDFTAPFIVCGTAPGHVPPLLVPDATNPAGFTINEGAVGAEYDIYGNDIRDLGRDCGNPSSSFRGNVCLEKSKCSAPSYPIPGEWDADTGNANGPTLQLVNSGDVCLPDYRPGCVLVLPLCPRGNGQGGAGFRAYCTDLGLFEITHVANHDINAIFRGRATINRGEIVGPADANGARIVALTG
jgi:Flp pilus assembly protein TadG